MSLLVVLAVASCAIATLAFLVLSRSRSGGRTRHGRAASALTRAVAPAAAIVPATALLTVWAPLHDTLAAAAVLWLACLPWLPRTGRWTAPAHAGWALTVAAGLAYVTAMAHWTVTSDVGGLALAGAWVLWLLEVAAFVMLLSYGWEVFDVLGSVRWHRRRAPVQTVTATPHAELPMVSIHVPSHNEPPELLIETLQRLLELDYPAYEVLVVDNNTDDDALCAPVEAFCAAHPERLRFHRLLDWPGFKSGALNYAEEHTDPRAELIAVVDADYQVEPDWLRATVGAFDDPRVAFVQTPQDYRAWSHSQYLRSLYYSYDYFFAVSQPSRDERGAAIFGGTMGLVRRSALRDIGGWDEWCVTEDAELSLRLLQAGWSGHHLDQSYGHGIMPLTFEALKRQRFRWCFGGMQILKRHWRTLLPWSRSTQLTASQRLGYLVGGVQWFGDLLGLLFSFVVMASLLDLAVGGGLAVRRLSGLLLFAAPALIVVGLVRAVAVLKAVGRDAGWRDALGAFAIWLSLGWVVSLACVRGLLEPQGVFLRTPKTRGDVSWLQAMRVHWAEMALATLGAVVALAGLVMHPGWVSVGLAALLAPPVLGWLAAPAHSVAALRVDLPASLRRRRDGEGARGWWRPRTAVPVASLAGALGVVALLLGIVQPGSHDAPRSSAAPSLPRRAEQPAPHAGAHVRTVPTTPSAGPSGNPATSTSSVPAGQATTQVPAPVRTAAPSTTAPATVSRPSTSSTSPTPTASAVTTAPTRGTGSPTVTARPTSPPSSPTATPDPSRRPTDRPTPTHR